MTDLNRNDDAMRHLLTTAKAIAVVGHSDKPHRTSYRIADYLRSVGYTVYAVNPTVSTIDREPTYPSLAALPNPVDIVNVFRRAEHLPGIVDEVLAENLPAMWTQLGVVEQSAIDRALTAGIDVAHDRCIMVEHRRLIG